MYFANEPKIRNWKASLTNAGCQVGGITPHHSVYKHNGELLFAFVHADIRDPNGTPLHPTALIRGHASLVVPRVTNIETGEVWFVMVWQRRTGNGEMSLEFPAGMLDGESNPLLVAQKELKEETGLNVELESIFPLSSKPLFPSSGLCDESIHYYGVDLQMSPTKLAALQGSAHGNANEGEFIRVELYKEADILKDANSMQTYTGYFLFRDYILSRKT